MEPLSDVTFKTSHLFDMLPLQLNGCLYLKKVCYTWRKMSISIAISGGKKKLNNSSGALPFFMFLKDLSIHHYVLLSMSVVLSVLIS